MQKKYCKGRKSVAHDHLDQFSRYGNVNIYIEIPIISSLAHKE